jgi:hypothetical protein
VADPRSALAILANDSRNSCNLITVLRVPSVRRSQPIIHPAIGLIGFPERGNDGGGVEDLDASLLPFLFPCLQWRNSNFTHMCIAWCRPVAISNHRLISFADQKVTFRWRDSAHKNEQRRMTLALDEFLRRFLLHLLPDGFVRIRNFGFLADRKRATNLPLCFQLLGAAATPPTEQDKSGAGNASDLWLCPKCAGPMVVVERLAAVEIQLRSPPRISIAA